MNNIINDNHLFICIRELSETKFNTLCTLCDIVNVNSVKSVCVIY